MDLVDTNKIRFYDKNENKVFKLGIDCKRRGVKTKNKLFREDYGFFLGFLMEWRRIEWEK